MSIDQHTPDSLANEIKIAREIDRETAKLQAARVEERADRDGQVAREFATTAQLVNVLTSV